jgi:hypothetical protein
VHEPHKVAAHGWPAYVDGELQRRARETRRGKHDWTRVFDLSSSPPPRQSGLLCPPLFGYVITTSSASLPPSGNSNVAGRSADSLGTRQCP